MSHETSLSSFSPQEASYVPPAPATFPYPPLQSAAPGRPARSAPTPWAPTGVRMKSATTWEVFQPEMTGAEFGDFETARYVRDAVTSLLYGSNWMRFPLTGEEHIADAAASGPCYVLLPGFEDAHGRALRVLRESREDAIRFMIKLRYLSSGSVAATADYSEEVHDALKNDAGDGGALGSDVLPGIKLVPGSDSLWRDNSHVMAVVDGVQVYCQMLKGQFESKRRLVHVKRAVLCVDKFGLNAFGIPAASGQPAVRARAVSSVRKRRGEIVPVEYTFYVVHLQDVPDDQGAPVEVAFISERKAHQFVQDLGVTDWAQRSPPSRERGVVRRGGSWEVTEPDVQHAQFDSLERAMYVRDALRALAELGVNVFRVNVSGEEKVLAVYRLPRALLGDVDAPMTRLYAAELPSIVDTQHAAVRVVEKTESAAVAAIRALGILPAPLFALYAQEPQTTPKRKREDTAKRPTQMRQYGYEGIKQQPNGMWHYDSHVIKRAYFESKERAHAVKSAVLTLKNSLKNVFNIVRVGTEEPLYNERTRQWYVQLGGVWNAKNQPVIVQDFQSREKAQEFIEQLAAYNQAPVTFQGATQYGPWTAEIAHVHHQTTTAAADSSPQVSGSAVGPESAAAAAGLSPVEGDNEPWLDDATLTQLLPDLLSADPYAHWPLQPASHHAGAGLPVPTLEGLPQELAGMATQPQRFRNLVRLADNQLANMFGSKLKL